MSEDSAPSPYGKQARKAERGRQARLSRLPFLYDYALRGRREAFSANLAQALLVIALVLVPTKLLTGTWLPFGAALIVLALAYAVQALSRYLNAQAGRR